MGCDIHIVVEKQIAPDKWVAVKLPEHPSVATYRNYRRFAALAGVRGEGPQARGLPEHLSDTGEYMIAEWSGDGHSHSWLPLDEAAAIFAQTNWLDSKDLSKEEWVNKYPASHFFDIDAPQGHRLVFWFDN